jgi:hypothetical protein
MNRFYSIESKEWERVVRHREHLRKIKDVHGRDVYTDDQLFTYREQFESDFAGSAVQVIDATEGGARKAHTAALPLREVIERYCRRSIPAEKWADRRAVRRADPAVLATGRDAVRARIAEVAGLRSVCEQMLGVLEELKGLVEQPDRFNKRIARVDELRAAVQRQERVYAMVTAVAQQAELRRFAADIKAAESEEKGVKRALAQLERDTEFVASLIEGADVMTEILEGALRRFDDALAAARKM